jgi:hypothetical protein
MGLRAPWLHPGALVLLLGSVARAAVLPVPDGDVPGLVAAVDAANATPEPDTIVLPCVAAFTLGTAAAGTTGLPPIATAVTIEGNGATIARDPAAPPFRLLEVAEGGDLTLRHATIAGGRADGGGGVLVTDSGRLTVEGGAIRENGCSTARCSGGGLLVRDDGAVVTLTEVAVTGNDAAEGGGIAVLNESALSLVRCRVTDNTVTAAEGTAAGGGIFASGFGNDITLADTLVARNAVLPQAGGGAGGGVADVAGASWTISGSTIADSSVVAAGDAEPGSGGGLADAGGEAIFSLVNSTVSGNGVTSVGGGPSRGGGAALQGGRLMLRHVTVAANTAGRGGGIDVASGTVTLSHAILATNSGNVGSPDCFGSAGVVTSGYNVLGDAAGCPVVPDAADVLGVDPLLGPLADNGGPTPTHALLPGSPATDAGSPAPPGAGAATCAAADQRGVVRPQGARCDAGAYEAGGPPPAVVPAAPAGCAGPPTTTPADGSTTTTTTIPAGCGARAASYASIGCRLAELVGAVEASSVTGRPRTGLLATARSVQTLLARAEALPAAKRRQARNLLRNAGRKLNALAKRLRARPGRAIAEPARAALLELGHARAGARASRRRAEPARRPLTCGRAAARGHRSANASDASARRDSERRRSPRIPGRIDGKRTR